MVKGTARPARPKTRVETRIDLGLKVSMLENAGCWMLNVCAQYLYTRVRDVTASAFWGKAKTVHIARHCER